MANISNVHLAKLHAAPSESIVVISDDQHGQLWYKLGQSRKLENLALLTDTSFQLVDQIAISLDDRWIAVTTVGEGHPIVTVYDLQAVLNDNQDTAEKARLTPLFIDPYPGYIQIIGWDEDKLILSSDVSLDNLSKQERRVLGAESGSTEKFFRWHIATDTIIQK